MIHLVCYLLSNFFNSSATGLRVYLGFGLPSGRPKWDISTTLFAFLSKAYFTVSKAATIRWLLVITPSFKGTLKSTLKITGVNFFPKYNYFTCKTYRMRTRLFARSNASMASLFNAIFEVLFEKSRQRIDGLMNICLKIVKDIWRSKGDRFRR